MIYIANLSRCQRKTIQGTIHLKKDKGKKKEREERKGGKEKKKGAEGGKERKRR
jgi:hypothetical protein